MNACLPIDLGPLSRRDTEDLVTSVFEASGSEVEGFAGRLFKWTGSNPFFVERILRSLLQSDRLVRSNGSWEGWDVQELELPHSVRDAILNRVALLAEESRRLVDLLTILGARTSYEVVAAVSELSDTLLQGVLDDLARHQLVTEAESGATLVYDFTHALIRETVESDLSLARRRTLHGMVGASLERLYGDRAEQHADELAYHFQNAHPAEVGTKAIHYLALAGGNALARFANREAMEYLQEALDRLDAAGVGLGVGGPGNESVGWVLTGLAKAKTRLGDRDASIKLWKRALATARAGGDLRAIAGVHRETGLALLWEDRLEEALEEFESALDVATEAGDELMVAQINFAAGLCHQHAGRGREALAAVTQALAIAKKTENLPMLAQAQSALVRLKIWTGDLSQVREHGEEALRLAEAARDPGVAFWSHWALAVAEGLFGNLAETARRIAETERIAKEVGSPVLQLWTAEVTVEHCFCTGEWERGIQVGEDAIAMARALDQRILLPRLLVWTSLIYLARGDHERARDLTDEAWKVSGADRLAKGELYLDVHTVLPAHIGRVAYLCSIGEWGEAIRVGEMGVGLADRTGYVVWGLHRLLPIMGEAHLRSRNLDRAREVAELLRSLSERLGHRSGLAWAEACDGLLIWLEGDPDEGARRLRQAAESL